jgi:hypothetical protein
MGEQEMGSLGKLYGSILSAPFKLINLPFKAYHEYYGDPKVKTVLGKRTGEEYKGTFLQKQRFKKIVPLLVRGKNIDPSDQKFMDIFNDFITSEGYDPIDQSKVNMDCDDKENCHQYVYNPTFRQRRYKKTKDDDSDDDSETEKTDTRKKWNIYLYDDLKIDKKKVLFDEGGDYGITILGEPKVKNKYTEIYLTTKRLPQNEFLIFRTSYKNPIGKNSFYEVYKDNQKVPYKNPISLGTVSAKIYFKTI